MWQMHRRAANFLLLSLKTFWLRQPLGKHISHLVSLWRVRSHHPRTWYLGRKQHVKLSQQVIMTTSYRKNHLLMMWKRVRHKEKRRISCWNLENLFHRKYPPPDMDQWADWVIPSWPGWLTSHSPCLPLNTSYPDQTRPGQINALATANEGSCKHTGQLYQHITTELEQYRFWYVNTNIWSVELRAVIGVSASPSTKYSQSPPSQIMDQSIQNLCSKLGGVALVRDGGSPGKLHYGKCRFESFFTQTLGLKISMRRYQVGSLAPFLSAFTSLLETWVNE